MPSVAEILGDAEIKRFLETNQNAAGRITHAAECLAAQADQSLAEGVAALKKLLPSLAEKVVSVFFSYKKKDEDAAKAIVQLLRENAANKLDITYQADFTGEIAGKSWREEINKAVRRANWFILLLPYPSDELDWCLYETGLFEARATSADRLICLHHPDTKVPSPIEGYHAVAATLPEVGEFLRLVFVNENPIFGLPAINRAIEGQIPDLAQRVVDAIRIPKGRLTRMVLEPCIKLHHDNAAVLKTKDDLDSATVLSANKEARDLFGLIEQKRTFAEWREGIEDLPSDGRWREELFHVIRKIANGRAFQPIQAVLHSPNGKIYHPVAFAVDRAGRDGPIEAYHVAFVEEVSTTNTTAMPKQLAVLAALLRFTFRFRWEVLEPFARGPLSDTDIGRLDASMTRLKWDWESHGSIDRDKILDVFTSDQRKRLDAMFTAWNRLCNADQTGELDLAIKKMDGQRIAALMASVLPVNQEFLEMAAARFAQMVSEK
jgi:hypothetical protein